MIKALLIIGSLFVALFASLRNCAMPVVTMENEPTIAVSQAADDNKNYFPRVVVVVVDRTMASLLDGMQVKTFNDTSRNIHPEAIAEIVALGKPALPYLTHITENGTWMEASIAHYAIDAIEPERYDLIFPSPDERFYVKANAIDFREFNYQGCLYGEFSIIDSTSEQILGTVWIQTYNFAVEWSQDSRYVAIETNPGKMSYVDIFDTQTNSRITLPSIEEIVHLYGSDKEHVQIVFPWQYVTIKDWVDSHTIYIDIHCTTYSDAKITANGDYTWFECYASYRYDLLSGAMEIHAFKEIKQ